MNTHTVQLVYTYFYLCFLAHHLIVSISLLIYLVFVFLTVTIVKIPTLPLCVHIAYSVCCVQFLYPMCALCSLPDLGGEGGPRRRAYLSFIIKPEKTMYALPFLQYCFLLKMKLENLLVSHPCDAQPHSCCEFET